MVRLPKNLIHIFLLVSLLSPFSGGFVHAASLTFSPSSFKLKSGDKKTVTVVLNTEGKKAFGAVGTIKFTDGSDVVRINNIVGTSEVGFNAIRVTDSSSSGDGRVSFTVINESYFMNAVNLATMEVEALKKGNATMEFTTSDSEPSTVADFDTSNELLTTKGKATFTIDSNSSSSSDDDDDDDDNNSSSSSSSSGSSVSTSTAVPSTGSEDLTYIALFGIVLLGTSFAVKRAFVS